MKNILILIALCTFAVLPARASYATNTQTVFVDGSYGNGWLDISANFSSESTKYNDTYYVSISNGVDVQIEFAIDAGALWRPYITDTSSATDLYVYCESYGDWFVGGATGLPTGFYTVSMSGPKADESNLQMSF